MSETPSPWGQPQGGIQDMEDILRIEYENALDEEGRMDERFANAFHNWELGEAGLRLDILGASDESGKKKGEAHVTAMLKMARQGSLKPLWDEYQDARRMKAIAHAQRKKIEARMNLEKSRNYRRRV